MGIRDLEPLRSPRCFPRCPGVFANRVREPNTCLDLASWRREMQGVISWPPRQARSKVRLGTSSQAATPENVFYPVTCTPPDSLISTRISILAQAIMDTYLSIRTPEYGCSFHGNAKQAQEVV